jgi:hypothetical protein
VLQHNYYTDKDVIVFATADREHAENYCKEKNQRQRSFHHYRVKGMKLKEVEK